MTVSPQLSPRLLSHTVGVSFALSFARVFFGICFDDDEQRRDGFERSQTLPTTERTVCGCESSPGAQLAVRNERAEDEKRVALRAFMMKGKKQLLTVAADCRRPDFVFERTALHLELCAICRCCYMCDARTRRLRSYSLPRIPRMAQTRLSDVS